MDHEELAAIAASQEISLERLLSVMGALTPHYGLRPDGIVDLASLGLTPKQRAQRERSIGGSDARIIAKGEPGKLLELAEIMRGERAHHDISGDLTVRCGHWLERLNLALTEEAAAAQGFCEPGTRITRHGEVARHPKVAHRHASLDGFLLSTFPGLTGIVECKAAVGFQKPPELIEKFWSQCQHNMWVAGVEFAYLSMTMGTYKHILQPIEFDPVYMAELAEAEEKFWQSVERGTEPKPSNLPPAVLDLSSMVETDMTASNAWADAAHRFIDHEEAAKILDGAKKDIKALFPKEARRAFGHGISASKAKNGAVTITKLPDEAPAEQAAEPVQEAAE
jgi:predicted phage-related endonuclease